MQKLFFASTVLFLSIVAGYISYKELYPCESPVYYTLGSFDPRFGLTEKEFLSDIKKAETLWEESIGKNLFEYSKTGNLTINLIYDTRQKITEQNKVLKADAEKVKDSALSIKTEYQTLQKEHEVLEKDYMDELTAFNLRQNTYNANVSHWNNRGGAPEATYNALIIEQKVLEEERMHLEEKKDSLDILVAKINEFIQTYNLLVSDVNSKITTINKTAGREFEEGVYDPQAQSITIYEFGSNIKLLRVLAHEFGHVLSIAHNDNSKSIMYEINKGETFSLSQEDITDLKRYCRIR